MTERYFRSKKHRFIFALLKLDGRKRAQALGITLDMYYDSDKAYQWYSEIADEIDPKTCDINGAKEAMERLEYFYARMTQKESK